MSFIRKEDGSYDRQKFNPEDVTDGKPRVVKFHLRKSKTSKDPVSEEELEIDREQTQFTKIPGFEEKSPEKRLLLNILSDLSSETIVILGKSKLDEKTVAEQVKKNQEWEAWKSERGIEVWEPNGSCSSSPSPQNTPTLKRKSSLDSWITSSASKKSKGKKTPGKGKVKNEKSESYSCDECDSSYISKAALSNHKASHQGITNCNDCDKTFSNKWNLKAHQKQFHTVL